MCGICGQYNFGDQSPVRLPDIKAMMDSIAHRGPDDEGQYIAGPLGFGFRRLSIIDLAGGHQPMADQEASVWVIFNGEIYNFQELRSELQGYLDWPSGTFASDDWWWRAIRSGSN